MTEQASSHELSIDPVAELKEFAGKDWDIRPGRGFSHISLHYPAKISRHLGGDLLQWHFYLTQSVGKPTSLFIKLGHIFSFHSELEGFELVNADGTGKGKRIRSEGIFEIDFDNMTLEVTENDETQTLNIRETSQEYRANTRKAKVIKK